MAFEWSALCQTQRLACGVLSRLEPDEDPPWIVSVRLAQPLPVFWKVKCLGSTLASKASGTLTGVWIETDRLPPIRVVLWEETGLQSRSAGFDSLTARKSFRCGLLASQLRSERSPRRSDSCRLIQYTSRGLPGSPLGFEPKARRFDSCLVFHSAEPELVGPSRTEVETEVVSAVRARESRLARRRF